MVIPHNEKVNHVSYSIFFETCGKFFISSSWCSLVLLVHFILKCNHFEWRWLFAPLIYMYMLIQTVQFMVQIIIITDGELFSETAVGCTASYLIVKCICFCCPPPLFWGCVLLCLRSPKGGCCSISDDWYCSCKKRNKIEANKSKWNRTGRNGMNSMKQITTERNEINQNVKQSFAFNLKFIAHRKN